MKKLLAFVLFALLFTFTASAQTTMVQPFVAGGIEFLPGGYVPYGGAVAGGVNFNLPHVLAVGEGGYQTGGKEDDDANTKTAGHTRNLRGDIFAHFGKWYAGPGCMWSKLYTPDYAKSAVHPRFGVGRDFNSGYVNRVIVYYVQAGTDKANNLQGVETQGYWFLGKYAFIRMDLGIYIFNATVIPESQGGSAQSVAYERSQHYSTGDFQTLVGIRF